MNWGTYGILIAFGLFVILIIFNPRISCFGKRTITGSGWNNRAPIRGWSKEEGK
jgi:hypothetical protein